MRAATCLPPYCASHSSFVVAAPGSRVTGAEIVAWSRDQMANYKVPRRIEIVDELPFNAAGKVMKDELRARAFGADRAGQP